MGQGMRRQNARLGRTISGVAEPPNLTGDPAGYDTSLFPNSRAIRRALAYLGYAVPINDQPLLDSTAVRRFQEDYNHAASYTPGKFDASVPVTVNGKMDKASLNALDHVLPYALDWRTYFRPKKQTSTTVDFGKSKRYRFSGCGMNRCYPGIAVMGCGCRCKGGGEYSFSSCSSCGGKYRFSGCGGSYRFGYERPGEGLESLYRFSNNGEGCVPYEYFNTQNYQCIPCAYYTEDNVGQGCTMPAPERDNWPGGGAGSGDPKEGRSPGGGPSGQSKRPSGPRDIATSTRKTQPSLGGYAARRQRALRSGRY